MKQVTQYIFLLLLSLTLASCAEQEGTIYSPQSETEVMFSFQASKMRFEVSPSDEKIVKVQVQRSNATGAFDLPVSLSTSSIFTLRAPTVHFAAGQNIAYAEIEYPTIDSLAIGTTYDLNFSFTADSLVSFIAPSGYSTVAISILRKLTWKNIGTATWTDGFIAPVFNLPAETYPVKVETPSEVEGLYRLVNPYGFEVYPNTGEADVLADPTYLEINAMDPNKVSIKQQGLGIDYGYGEFFVLSQPGRYGVLSGKTITFAAQDILCGMKGYNNGAPAFYAGAVTCVLP